VAPDTKRAFTILELIAVIVVLAIVAGILFPALASSKHSAKAEVAKQYLRQQLLAIDMYTIDFDGVYPGYQDIVGNKAIQAPCSPLYDWKRPCWAQRQETVSNPLSDAPSPMIGGRGYIYAIRDWREIDQIGKDDFLGWDRSKPYPVLCDIFSSQYRVLEFSGQAPDVRACINEGIGNPSSGCLYPDRMWFAYSDGSLKVWKRTVNTSAGTHLLFDWLHVFLRKMDADTQSGE